MNLLSADNLALHFGERTLFSGLSFGLEKGDKTALIAANGTGKSSLLQILAGKNLPDEGEVAVHQDLRIGYLEQHPQFNEDLTLKEVVRTADLSIRRIIREYESALKTHAHKHSSETGKALENATAKMDQTGGWDFDRRLIQILDRFRITNLDQEVSSLSGGQIKRLALSLVLVDNPDLLLLDEPTNHLDIEMIEWLESYLSLSSITFLMVTHDRYFLDRICNRIFELDTGSLYSYPGNYEKFLEKKAERESSLASEKDRADKYVKRELDWIRRMPKARGTKSKSRIEAFHNAREQAKSTKEQGNLNLNVNMRRVGGKILEIKGLSKKYGDLTVLEDFNYSFIRGEKIGIIGPNGSGKSTLLNLITGREKPDHGTVVTGDTIVYGYYTQEGIRVNETKRVIDVVKDVAEIIEVADGSRLTASQFLQFFLFPPSVQYDLVSKLSGGEKRRLYLLTVLINNPNFLILDEPTNDLDIVTLSRLEEFLTGFKGCLILVSHDRYLLDRLVDHLFVFGSHGQIDDYYGSYSDYKLGKDIAEEEEKQTDTENKKRREVNEKASNNLTAGKKRTYKEKQEYERLEKEIRDLEEEKTSLEECLNSGENDYEILEKASSRIGEIIILLDKKTMRWLELDELS